MIELDDELKKALEDWIPYWRQPQTQDEWDKLVAQKAVFARSIMEAYESAIAEGMPKWFIQRIAKIRYNNLRRYCRTKRRAEICRQWPNWTPEERLIATIRYDL